MTPSPRTMHQNAIVAEPAEPKGKGAAATVTKRIKDEIRFDGICTVVVTLPSTGFDGNSIAFSAAKTIAPSATRFKQIADADYCGRLAFIVFCSTTPFVAATIGSLTVAVTNLM